MTNIYREVGVILPATEHASPENAKLHRGRALVIAPPSALNSTWSRKFAPFSVGIASGWMRVRGIRRRRGADRGFVLSDHVDFPAMLQTIEETAAERIIATHGYTDALVPLMQARGLEAAAFETQFGGEEELSDVSPDDVAATQHVDASKNMEAAES
jgi:putative mRNA 3-end processing factor